MLILLSPKTVFAAAPEIKEVETSILNPTDSQANTLLKSKPTYFKEDAPLATVGVVPYTLKDGEVWILLGRETEDKTWSDFGGKVNKEDESFAAALKREYIEETAGAGVLTDEQLKANHTFYFYIHKPGKRQILYVFCLVAYQPESSFLEAVNKANTEETKEKDQFKWFSLEDFLSFQIKDLEGYPLRKFFRQDVVNSSEFTQIIQRLKEKKLRKAA
ncbi:MAG: NUDIX hydrolase [Candidatus Paracaedibacteraceae bacterium]|nr:NUDIX hydrolase [Candidatus Paracaedibacteraceae bacterium]